MIASTLLSEYRGGVSVELARILDFWSTKAIDELNGGFFGELDRKAIPVFGAIKGAVLNARILWTFSAAVTIPGYEKYRPFADRAYRYCRDFIVDKNYGGVFWTVNYGGTPCDTRKQVYAAAFALYAFSEYFRCSGDDAALELAMELFTWVERVSFDPVHNGYFEALDRFGTKLDDVRLSKKDQNDPKTMNTHLHILEAYTNLYRVWNNSRLKKQLTNLVALFLDKIIDPETAHCNLFFTEDWSLNSSIVSYGHDIEASWLIGKAAEELGDSVLLARVRTCSLKVAMSACEGLQPDGSMYHEYDTAMHEYKKHREWWVSAEAAVGFMHCYQLTNDELWLARSLDAWRFINNRLIDNEYGEWFWGLDDELRQVSSAAKASIWKCPYHNSRFCMEILRRCGEIANSQRAIT